MNYLVYGANGWIGSMIVNTLHAQGKNVVIGQARLEYRDAVIQELKLVSPSYVLCAAGITGRPNVDWCEDHAAETVRGNVLSILNLVDCVP